MKTKKYFFALAILGALVFASCTPNSINDDDTQQVDKRRLKKNDLHG